MQLVSPITFVLLVCLYLRGLSAVMCLCAMVIDFASFDDFLLNFEIIRQCDILFSVYYICMYNVYCTLFPSDTGSLIFAEQYVFICLRNIIVHQFDGMCIPHSYVSRSHCLRVCISQREKQPNIYMVCSLFTCKCISYTHYIFAYMYIYINLRHSQTYLGLLQAHLPQKQKILSLLHVG